MVVASAYDLEADVKRVLTTFDVPGISIAIVKDGQVIAARGFGVRKLGEATPVDGKTIFEIASNSKVFTAAALAMLRARSSIRRRAAQRASTPRSAAQGASTVPTVRLAQRATV